MLIFNFFDFIYDIKATGLSILFIVVIMYQLEAFCFEKLGDGVYIFCYLRRQFSPLKLLTLSELEFFKKSLLG